MQKVKARSKTLYINTLHALKRGYRTFYKQVLKLVLQ